MIKLETQGDVIWEQLELEKYDQQILKGIKHSQNMRQTMHLSKLCI